MSLLLDALNKADQERKRNQATPGINSNHEQAIGHDLRNKSIIIIVACIIGFAILLAAIYWLGQRSATPTGTTTSVASSIPPTPGVTQNSAVKKQSTAAQKSVASSQDEIDTSEENVASLYQQNVPTQNTNATLTISTPTTDTAINTPENPPVTAPASVAPQQSSTTTTSITQFANLPDLHDLPNQVLEKIPTLNYSEHNFNINGGSVKINGTIHHANDQLANGLVIDKILEDGMILHIDNYSFKMRALNSWVNM